jgi:hypothetical protein
MILCFGLLVSAITDAMQQAMFVSWIFMVILILMNGLFMPLVSHARLGILDQQSQSAGLFYTD